MNFSFNMSEVVTTKLSGVMPRCATSGATASSAGSAAGKWAARKNSLGWARAESNRTALDGGLFHDVMMSRLCPVFCGPTLLSIFSPSNCCSLKLSAKHVHLDGCSSDVCLDSSWSAVGQESSASWPYELDEFVCGVSLGRPAICMKIRQR